MNTRTACLLATLALGACASPPPPHESAACVPKTLATLPVDFVDDIPTTTVTLDGQEVRMALDLGAEITVLGDASADRMRLRREASNLPVINGVGGSATRWAAVATRFTMGGLTLKNRRMEVAPITLADGPQRIDGTIGLDILSKYDMDWDLPRRTVTLNQGAGCDGPPVGWPAKAVRVPLRHPGALEDGGTPSRLLLLPIAVDGRATTAMLDSGAGISLISPAAAASFEPSSLSGGVQVGLAGVGPGSPTGTIHRFQSLTVAGESFPDWLMVVAPVPLWAGDVILGAQYLRARRSWLPADLSSIWFAPASPAAPSPTG